MISSTGEESSQETNFKEDQTEEEEDLKTTQPAQPPQGVVYCRVEPGGIHPLYSLQVAFGTIFDCIARVICPGFLM